MIGRSSWPFTIGQNIHWNHLLKIFLHSFSLCRKDYPSTREFEVAWLLQLCNKCLSPIIMTRYAANINQIKNNMNGIQTHNHWITFKHANRLSYQAMSSTHTQSQLCPATPISTFVQCQVSFRLLPSSVTTFALIEICLR